MSKKILIIGLGSIGQRHLKNLFHLGYSDVSLVRTNGAILNDYPNLNVYASISEACSEENFDMAIISTPTANHFSDFNFLADYNVKNIYIEKPITHSVTDAEKIKKITLHKKLNVVVGYDLHFDLGLLKVKELLLKKTVGNICSFQVEVGQYLPDWRPNQDYREGMSAKKVLGGGVMLDLIHEFDYVTWIFGPMLKVFGKNKHISDLEIETEDISLNILETKNGVLGTISLDYLQKELARTCKIVGDKGTILWNYKESKVSWLTHDNTTWNEFEYSHIERNDRFRTIIKTFIESEIEKLDFRLTNVNDAIASLKMVEAAKKSNIENKFINV
ncbi:MAG: Gfo/Idh/MocA family oxidoreductase [Flavobacteriaceae bacterium]